MADVLTTINTRTTPQSRPADDRQVRNAAGGHGFPVDDWTRVHRFLTLGTDGGTYYTSARDLTADAAGVVLRAAAADPVELVRRIVEVSTAGRAPKQNPALFALAIAAAAESVEGRRAALAALPHVARTGTHLFLFARYVEQFRGWGPALKKAVAGWYTSTPTDKLAYQLVKYRQREGWSHRDLLRLSHPVTADATRRALFNFVCRGGYDGGVPAVVDNFVDAQRADTPQQWVSILRRVNAGLSWEMLPDAALGHREVWEALIDNGMPITALMRQLPRLTRLGVTRTRGAEIVDRLTAPAVLRRGRVHPINILVAQRTYAGGMSARGQSTWTPDPKIADALDAAFYAAFDTVEPAGKRTLLALDVSGSMGFPIAGMPLTCREAAGALAMVAAATEPEHRIVGFTAGNGSPSYRLAAPVLRDLDISPRRRLDDVCRYMDGLPFGATDCAAPMVWALKHRIEVDTFVILTDSETWYGKIHPHQALRQYREQMGIDARLAVVALAGNGYSIADPADPGQMDVSGFDSAAPELLTAFARGEV